MGFLAYIGLGSNQQDPVRQLHQALDAIAALPTTSLLAHSGFYRSAPVGYLDQPDFVNAVASVRTGLAPEALLHGLLDIEQRQGRQRTFRNAPRTLDLDVLLYADREIDRPGLRVPHPAMHLRAFVLLPLLELAPECVIPGIGSARLAVAACADQELERMPEGQHA